MNILRRTDAFGAPLPTPSSEVWSSMRVFEPLTFPIGVSSSKATVRVAKPDLVWVKAEIQVSQLVGGA